MGHAESALAPAPTDETIDPDNPRTPARSMATTETTLLAPGLAASTHARVGPPTEIGRRTRYTVGTNATSQAGGHSTTTARLSTCQTME